MTFDDMDDVSLAAEYYMLSSQVDGEQDLVELTPKKPAPTTSLSIVNGVRQNRAPGNLVKLEPSVSGNVLVNGNNITGSIINNSSIANNVVLNGTNGGTAQEGSILARHLGVVTVRATPNQLPVQSSVVTVPAASTPNQDTTFSCQLCSAKLKNKRNFDTHMKRHRGELPFKCDECPKTFQGRRDLETHKRSRHDPSKKTIVSVDNSPSVSQQQNTTSSTTVSAQAEKHKTIILSMNSIPNPLLQGKIWNFIDLS